MDATSTFRFPATVRLAVQVAVGAAPPDVLRNLSLGGQLMAATLADSVTRAIAALEDCLTMAGLLGLPLAEYSAFGARVMSLALRNAEEPEPQLAGELRDALDGAA